jgi:O-antigen ligase
MMRFLLFLIICVLAFSDTSGITLSLGAGMSAKNLLVYMGAGWLLLQRALGPPVKVELQTIQICFVVLITYATVTMFIATGIIHYQGYDLFDSAMALKIELIDSFVFFMVFFYGTRTIVDARSLLKMLLFVVSIANLFTIAKARGIIDFGAPIMVVVPDSIYAVSRIDGVFGDANETATMIACLLPVYASFILSAKGFGKIFWIACMTLSAVVMFMTVSRGALVGLLLGTLWAAYLCRRYLSLRVAIKWGSAIFAIAAVVALIAGGTYLNTYIHRFTGVYLSSAADVSAGRSDIWVSALMAMMNSPVSLITGFGWNTWAENSVIFFFLVAHNHYLSLWFELGLIGVVSFIVIFHQLVTTALRTAAISDSPDRSLIIAFVFSFLILVVGIFFVLLFKPWMYLWPFIGIAMRYTVNVRSASRNDLDLQPAKTSLKPSGTSMHPAGPQRRNNHYRPEGVSSKMAPK